MDELATIMNLLYGTNVTFGDCDIANAEYVGEQAGCGTLMDEGYFTNQPLLLDFLASGAGSMYLWSNAERYSSDSISEKRRAYSRTYFNSISGFHNLERNDTLPRALCVK